MATFITVIEPTPQLWLIIALMAPQWLSVEPQEAC